MATLSLEFNTIFGLLRSFPYLSRTQFQYSRDVQCFEKAVLVTYHVTIVVNDVNCSESQFQWYGQGSQPALNSEQLVISGNLKNMSIS